MGSSLIFAALAAAWLAVLVPMFARRRQEVSKTADTVLAARVVRRGGEARGRATKTRREGAVAMSDADREDAIEEHGLAGEHDSESRRQVHSADTRAGRRYRPGRGGFDPEAAAIAAHAKYIRRQRIVLAMLIAVVVTAALAALVWSPLWWVHGAVDLSLAGYLTYLRRQVKIEQDIRNRRLARLNGERRPRPEPVEPEYEDEPEERREPVAAQDDVAVRRAAGRAPAMPCAVPLEIDDEDPMFDELEEHTWESYRRVAGE